MFALTAPDGTVRRPKREAQKSKNTQRYIKQKEVRNIIILIVMKIMKHYSRQKRRVLYVAVSFLGIFEAYIPLLIHHTQKKSKDEKRKPKQSATNRTIRTIKDEIV